VARVPAWQKGLAQWSPQSAIATRMSSQLPRIPCQGSRDANKSRDANTCEKFDAWPCPTDVRSAGATRRTRAVAAVSGRTHNKDSLAARKPCHSTTSHISPMRLGTRFDRRTTLRLKLTELAARSRAAKTRMNAEFSRQVETRRHVSIDARPLFYERRRNLARVRDVNR
jgi:hypothetical protein